MLGLCFPGISRPRHGGHPVLLPSLPTLRMCLGEGLVGAVAIPWDPGVGMGMCQRVAPSCCPCTSAWWALGAEKLAVPREKPCTKREENMKD